MNTFPLSKVSDLPEGADVVIIDTESTGLNIMTDTPFMIQLDLDGNQFAVEWVGSDQHQHLVNWITDHLIKSHINVFHNAKFDYHMFINGGVHPDLVYRLPTWCTQVAEALLDEHRFTYALNDLGEEFFETPKASDELKEWILANIPNTSPTKGNPNYWMGYLSQAPREMVAYYGIGDISITGDLYDRGVVKIKEQELMPLVMDVEMPMLKALLEMERRGVRVDKQRVNELGVDFTKRQKDIQSKIIDLVGYEVNPRSPLQMTDAFNKFGLGILYNPPTKAMKKKDPMRTQGNPSFNKDTLALYDHPFINLLTSSRTIKTMLDTFINGSLAKATDEGLIHTNFNQTKGPEGGTGTGRLSSNNPNLQQIPKRDGELAPLIRSCFIPYYDDHSIIANDWEQFEFRMFAHFVRDDALTQKYQDDPTTDFHDACVEMTGQVRDRAKRINLGLVFGMGEGLLAKECGLPFEKEIGYGGKSYLKAGPEAQAIFAEYHRRFPKAKQFLTQAANIAKSRGYVKTLLGRRLRFPGGKATHKAGGLVFQGSSADVMKQKTIIINNEFRNTDTIFNLVVHDEFVLSSPTDQAHQVADRVKQITEDVPLLRIPILADAGVGSNWWQAH